MVLLQLCVHMVAENLREVAPIIYSILFFCQAHEL